MLRHPKPRRLALVAAVACGALPAIAALGPGGDWSGPGSARAAAAKGPLDRAVRRLQDAQRRDGGFAASRDAGRSDPALSAWAALALAAAGIHPADQPRSGTTALAYLRANGDRLRDTGDVARLLLVLRAADDGDHAAGRTARATLLARQAADGGFPERRGGPRRVSATAFALLALAGDDDPAAAPARDRAAGWLRAAFSRRSRTGGGWGPTAGARPQAGLTGLAMQALRAVDPGEFDLSSAAQQFLRDSGRDDGGLGATDSKRSDPVATAWAMQGLQATGFAPATYVGVSGTPPRRYLTSRQAGDGGFGSVLRTAQIVPGLNATAFPLDAVARGSSRASRRAPADERPNAAASGGDGGARALDRASASEGDGARNQSARAGSGGGATSGGATTADSGGATGSDGAAAARAARTAAARRRTRGADAAPTGQVDGVVVGAQSPRPPAAAGVAAGSAGDGGDETTLALVGGLVLVAGLGSQLERRRPRRVLS